MNSLPNPKAREKCFCLFRDKSEPFSGQKVSH
jgi:hypothetical protein